MPFGIVQLVLHSEEICSKVQCSIMECGRTVFGGYGFGVTLDDVPVCP